MIFSDHSVPEAAYKINPASSLHWASWNDEYVVFDEGSGQTYQMDPLRAFVLNALTENPQFFGMLLEELASIPALTGNAHIPEVLGNVLHEFQAHGLVEVAPR